MIKQKPKLGTYRASHDRTPKYTVKQVGGHDGNVQALHHPLL